MIDHGALRRPTARAGASARHSTLYHLQRPYSWGANGKLVLDRHGWEVQPDKDRKTEDGQHKGTDNSRDVHVRNFLDRMRSRKRPVTDVEIGHRVSTIAHLGNVALRSQRPIR